MSALALDQVEGADRSETMASTRKARIEARIGVLKIIWMRRR
jgi:hypothetical protein